MATHVFISYSHDSQDHKDRVLALSDRLREDGIDCEIDQYEQSPPEGWPRWMRRQIKAAHFVLIVCTATYGRRFTNDEESGRGKGARWEGAIITQDLYESDGNNSKFIPLIFSSADTRHIPDVLTSATHYVCDGEGGYELLYRRLTNQHDVSRRKIGAIRSLPPRQRISGMPQAVNKTRLAAGKPTSRSTGAVKRSTQRKSGSTKPSSEMAVLRSEDGALAALRLVRVEASELLALHVRMEDPSDFSFLNSLRHRPNVRLTVAYDLRAAAGRLADIRSAREGGKETWVLSIREEPSGHNAFAEMSYNGMSADHIAEARARELLLGEKIPERPNFLASMIGWGSRQQKPEALWADLVHRFGNNKAVFLAVARSALVMELWVAGIVEHVERLNLKFGRDGVSVDFVGQRPRAFANKEPIVISIQGKRR